MALAPMRHIFSMFTLLPIAFISGVLTVFSPCVLPILPIILASGIAGEIQRVRGVITGLVLSFFVASLLLSVVVRIAHISADAIRFGAVILLIVLGITMAFPKLWAKIQFFIETHWKIHPVQKKGNGFIAGFITGVSLGIVWTPCVGPVIATVATLAAVNTFSFISVLIVFSYALGTGIPLYFIAKGGTSVTGRLTFFKKNNEQIRQAFGVIILLTAFGMYWGIDRRIQAWATKTLPSSWTQLGANFEESSNANSLLKNLKK